MQRRCILGIDPGERWLGLARATAESRIAFPLGTIDLRAVNDDPISAIRALLEGDAVAEVVIGVPVRADGEADRQAARFRRLGVWLAAQFGAPWHEQSERHSSAETSLRPRTVSRRRTSAETRRREQRDSHARAAARILQRWLDQLPAEAP